MYRPNYVNTTPIAICDAASPYSDGLVLTRANHEENVSANAPKNYYRLSDIVFPQSVTANDWMRIDAISGGHVVLLGAMLECPEWSYPDKFSTAYLRNVSFSGLLHTNTTSLVDQLHLFTWTGLTGTAASDNAGRYQCRNYNLLSAGSRQCNTEKSFILAADNFGFSSSELSHNHAVVVGFGIFNPTTTVASAVDVRFTLTASQHLTERPAFDPSRD